VNEEASATARVVARTLRDLYVALVGEGFTENQALIVVTQCIAAQIAFGGNSE
jgi:hypothetical protein